MNIEVKSFFDGKTPDFVGGNFKWYVDSYLQNYIETNQATNLPKLKELYYFVVKGNDKNF